MEVRLLGPVCVKQGTELLSLPSGKPLAVFAMLALEAPDTVSTCRLVQGLWGPDAPESAHKTLQVHMSGLRKRLRGHGLEVTYTAAGYRLDVAAQSVDVVRFAELARDGVRELQAGRPEIAGLLLRSALDLWSGDQPLANIDAPFVGAETERLRLRRREATRARVDADLALGLGAALVEETSRAVESDPYDEHACGQLARALYHAGQTAAALEELSALRVRLRDDLGLDPSPELVELERKLLSHDEALAAPIRVSEPGHNLPEYVSTFIGRNQELDDLDATLSRSRLITVTGPGGAGKTRLAVAAAAAVLSRFPDGVWLADLAPVSTISEIISALATAVGIRPGADAAALAEALRARRTLLVLDNCEHVVDDVADLTTLLLRRCPTLRVLTTSREPLAIDGERVYRIPSLQVPDPASKGHQALADCDAVRLFADRATLHQRRFTLDAQSAVMVARICRRVDGLPLGIELAAARLAVLSLGEIDRRLDQRLSLLSGGGRRVLARQQTLRALIGWSYDILDPHEQLLLSTLSVFVGGFDLDAVDTVTARAGRLDAGAPPALDLISNLVAKSLVESMPSDRPRFRLLETVREYAAEQLATRGEAVNQCRCAHADHYAQLAATGGPDLERGQHQPEWLKALDADYDNLRAAWNHLLENDDIADGLAMCTNLRRYWIVRGRAGEGARASMSFIKRAGTEEDHHAYGMALGTAASLFWELGDLDEAAALAQRATDGPQSEDLEVLARAGRIGALVMVARGQAVEAAAALNTLLTHELPRYAHLQLEGSLAYALLATDDLAAARTVLRTHIDALRKEGDLNMLATALHNLSSIEIVEANMQGAREALTEGLEIAGLMQDVTSTAFLKTNLALLELRLGDVAAARTNYAAALGLVRADEDPLASLYSINGLVICTDPESPSAATLVRLHGGIRALSESYGLLFDRTERELREAHCQRLSNHLGAVECARLTDQGSTLTLPEAVNIAQSLAQDPDYPLGEATPTRPRA